MFSNVKSEHGYPMFVPLRIQVSFLYSQLTQSAVHPHTLCRPQRPFPFFSHAIPAASKALHPLLRDKTDSTAQSVVTFIAGPLCFLRTFSQLRHCANSAPPPKAHVETTHRLFASQRRHSVGGMQRHDLSGLREDQSQREHLPT